MSRYVSIITIVIVSILVFVGNLVNSAIVVQASLELQKLNALKNFINITTDRAIIKKSDLQELNLELAKTSSIYDYKIEVKSIITFKDREEYIIGDIITKEDSDEASHFSKVKLKQGDRITITIFKKTKTNSEMLLSILTNGVRVSQNKTALSGMVR